jgi:hypothetical protein
VTLLPWVQHMIEQTGWRTACTAMGILCARRARADQFPAAQAPEDIGLLPDGDARPRRPRRAASRTSSIPVGQHRLDAAPRAAHRAVLVDLARYFCGL